MHRRDDEFPLCDRSSQQENQGPPLPPPPPSESHTRVLPVGPIAPADVAGLCARLRIVIESAGSEVVACDVRALAADLLAVEALARLQLTARRLGTTIRLRGAGRELVALLGLCGLDDLFDRGDALDADRNGEGS